MVFFYESFAIKEEDSNLALFESILFMNPDDLAIQIKRFHTVSGNTDTKICTGRYFIAYFYFREAVRIKELAGKPLAVGGDSEARHGIVLTANYIARRQGVKTGMALWQARQVCPELIFVPPRMDLYLKFSSMLREIYSDYTDKIEPYGCDEAWLDVTNSISLKGDGRKVAEEISARVKRELGITVSEGVSWNKIYAKLGSDYKKPDAITEFNRENYKSIIWKLPVSDLLYVGRSTNKTLAKYGIHVMLELGMSRATFYRKKKAALRYLGYYFFEIVVPQSANKRYKPSFPVEEE